MTEKEKEKNKKEADIAKRRKAKIAEKDKKKKKAEMIKIRKAKLAEKAKKKKDAEKCKMINAKMKKKKIELAKKEAKMNKIRKAKIAEAEKKKKAKQKQKQKKMSIKRSTISVKSFKNYELINLTTFLPPKNKSLQFTNKRPIDAAKKAVNRGYQYFGLRLKSNKSNEGGIIRIYNGKINWEKNPRFDNDGKLKESYEKNIKIRRKSSNNYDTEKVERKTILYDVNEIKNDETKSLEQKQKELEELKKEYINSRQYQLEKTLYLKKVEVKNTSLVNQCVKKKNGLIRSVNKNDENLKKLIINEAKKNKFKEKTNAPQKYNGKSTAQLQKAHIKFIQDSMFTIKDENKNC